MSFKVWSTLQWLNLLHSRRFPKRSWRRRMPKLGASKMVKIFSWHHSGKQILFLSCISMYLHNAIFFSFTDPEYRKFLESYCADEEKICANPEILLGEIEAKTRELIGLFSWFFLLLRILNTLFIYLYAITCKRWPVQSNRLRLSQLIFCYSAKQWQENTPPMHGIIWPPSKFCMHRGFWNRSLILLNTWICSKRWKIYLKKIQ